MPKFSKPNMKLAWLMLLAGLLATVTPAHADQLIGAPGAGGSGAWTVYAFGNAQAISDVFRSVANFTASVSFQALVGFIAVGGALSVGMASGFSSAVAQKFIGYIVTVFLVCYFFFGVNGSGGVMVNVEIQDVVDGTWKAPVTVPAAVGIPAAVISTAGHEFTAAIESSFPLPDAMKMSNGAPFDLAAALINDAGQARITDQNIASSMAYYVQDCVIPAIAQGQIKPITLISSTSFLDDIKVNLPGVMVNTLLAQGSVGIPTMASCSSNGGAGPSMTQDGYSLLVSAINAQGNDASSFLQNASAWARTPALNVVNSAADAVAQWSSNNGITDGGSLVKQSAMLSVFTGAFKQAAAQTGNSDFITGLAVEQAHSTQITSWVVGAEIFNRTMGYIYSILQVCIFGFTPLILAATLIPGLGVALFKNFAQILLWLALWQPMLAIVNFVVLSMQQADLGGALASPVPNGVPGFSLATQSIISEKTANMRAAANFVGTMVPALSWALVKGGLEFSRVIGAAVGEHLAQGAASTMTTGNFSLNQGSMDSFTANKHSTGHQSDTGWGYTSTGQGEVSRNVNMGGTSITAGPQRVGINQTAGLNTGEAVNDGTSASHSRGGGNNASQVESGSVGSASSDSDTVGTQEVAGRGSSVGGGGNGSVSMPLMSGKPAGGKPAAGGSPSGDKNGDQTINPAVTSAKKTDKGGGPNANLSLTGSATGQATHNLSNSRMDQLAHQRQANHSNAGTVGVNAAENTMSSQTAGKQSQAGTNAGITVTGLASDAAMSQLNQQTLRQNDWGGLIGGAWSRPVNTEPMNGKLGDTIKLAGNTNSIVGAYSNEYAKATRDEAKLDKKADSAYSNGVGHARRALGAAEAEEKKLSPSGEPLKIEPGAEKKSAAANAKEAVIEAAVDTMEMARNGYNDIVDGVANGMEATAGAASVVKNKVKEMLQKDPHAQKAQSAEKPVGQPMVKKGASVTSEQPTAAHPQATAPATDAHPQATAPATAAHPQATAPATAAHPQATAPATAAHPQATASATAAHPQATAPATAAHPQATAPATAAHPQATAQATAAHPQATAPATDAHPQATAPATAAHPQATAPATAAHPQATAPAQAAHPQATAPATAAHPQASAQAQAAHPQATAPAQAAHPQATAPATAAHPQATAPAQAAHPQATAPAQAAHPQASAQAQADSKPDPKDKDAKPTASTQSVVEVPNPATQVVPQPVPVQIPAQAAAQPSEQATQAPPIQPLPAGQGIEGLNKIFTGEKDQGDQRSQQAMITAAEQKSEQLNNKLREVGNMVGGVSNSSAKELNEVLRRVQDAVKQ